KAQQDALLPSVEDGTLTLIGATTENPYFEVNAPLLSRSTLFRLEPLTAEDLAELVRRGLDAEHATAEDDALALLVERSAGDGRQVLTSLEVAVALADGRARQARADGGSGGDGGNGSSTSTTGIVVRLDDVEAALGASLQRYGRDDHYDVISAFIKSLRGSDPQAGLYWLARMIEAGEDPRFIARRLVISASEDIGLADPQALPVAVAAFQALEFVGLPEARLNLAEAVVYLALAPKSNSAYLALAAAARELEEAGAGRVPGHLQSASHPGERKLGIGVGYAYPHDHPDHWVAQRYLPEGLRGGYYRPSDQGSERALADAWRERRAEPPAQEPPQAT
ncbi:MAG TPA: replication-associated recombination protein A, partial [Actinomycetota bacterium]|nr:replication-associated recombination protein A [Actinomycetota bacterium]